LPIVVLSALQRARAGLVLERLDDGRRRRRADVGHDQRLLEAFPRFGVERAEQARLDLRAERLARLGHALAQAFEQPPPARGGLAGIVVCA
jgi:hypothetical protein